MPKNNERNEQTVKYLKEKYPEVFEKYDLEKDLSNLQATNLAQFLEQERATGEENGAFSKQSEKGLERIYTVVSQEKKIAVMINIDKEGKIPEGELGVYYLEGHEHEYEFNLTNERIREKVRESIEKYANNTLTAKEKEKMIDEIAPKKLEDIGQLTTPDLEKQIDQKARTLVDIKIDEINHENGIPKEKRKELEEGNKNKKESVTIGQEQDKQENAKDVPEDVERACMKLGVTNIKGYFYVNAKQLGEKVDNISVDKNGGKVLMIQVANEANLAGPDRYFGMQDEKMVLYGTQDKEVEQVTRKSAVPPTDGKLVEPLKQDEPTYVEFSDTEGMTVQEKLKENMNLSVQDLANYQKEVEKLLDQYSKNVAAIDENSSIEENDKIKMLMENNENFNRLNTELAEKYGIDLENVKAINFQAKEYTEEVQEEVEQQDTGDEYDELGRLQPPGKRMRGM